MPDVIIRPLGAADFQDYVALLAELVGVEKVLGGAAGRARFQAILAQDGTTLLGAEVEAQIVAVASLHLHLNLTYLGRPYCLVENVVTRASHRGRGLGSALMRALIAQAWAADAYKIMLLTGRDYGAKGFYERLGFTDADKHAMTLRREPARR